MCVWLCLGPAQQQQQQREAGQQQQMEGAVLLRGGCRAVQVVAESVFQQQMGVRADACQERGERERGCHTVSSSTASAASFSFLFVYYLPVPTYRCTFAVFANPSDANVTHANAVLHDLQCTWL